MGNSVSVRWGAGLAGLAMVLAGLVAPATGVTPAEPASAATTSCDQLAAGLPCTVRYEDHPGESTILVPSGVDQVTVMLAGGAGGNGDSTHAVPGPGGIAIAIIDTTFIKSLDVWLGEQAQEHHGGRIGWAPGGDGGDWDAGFDGYGGGAASGLAYTGDGHHDPLLVAGGGGGGGAFVVGLSGGAGGFGGDPAGSGANGRGDLFGAGGKGGAHDEPRGESGGGQGDAPAYNVYRGGGGGGGGGGHPGGDGGGWGSWEPGGWGWSTPGGGGGGASFARDGVTMLGSGTSPIGHGWITLYPGTPVTYECDGSEDARIIDIPDDVHRYTVIAVGGAGGPGSNLARGGHGAVVTGTLDVPADLHSLHYWVGCSGDRAEHAGAGFGRGGEGGRTDSVDANYGGRGGGATALRTPDGTMLMVAGGGGGAGGDINGCTEAPGSDCGGAGGSGGGEHGSRLPADGTRGGSNSGGAGGKSNAHHHDGAPDHDGGGGVSPPDLEVAGGGGGGGSGYPMGGDGGHHDDDDGGGGGGAGGSYVNSNFVKGGTIATAGAVARKHDPANGYLLMIPIVTPNAMVSIAKEVTGDAGSYAQGPFTIEVTCTMGGTQYVHRILHLRDGDIQPVAAPVGSSCTITETGTGGASTPAPPRVIEVTGTMGLTLENEFAATSLAVTVRSAVYGEDNQPTTSVTLDPGSWTVGVGCTLDGHELVLPAPVVNGSIPVAGSDTFAEAGVTAVIDGLPVGARCTVQQQPGSGATETGYIVNGAGVLPGHSFELLATPNTVDVGNAYALAPLAVAKTTSGEAPSGVEFAGSVECSFHGTPVVFETPRTFDGLTAGGGVLVHDMPVNAHCTLTETTTHGASAVGYSPARTVPIAEHDNLVTITNTYATEPLVVIANSSGAGMPWVTGDLSLRVTCTEEGTTVLDEPFTVPATGDARTFEVVENAVCSVVELDARGATQVTYASGADPTPSASPVQVMVGPTQTTLLVDNVFEASPLALSVSTSGDGAQFADPGALTVGDCTFAGSPVEVAPGQASMTFPYGATGGHASIGQLAVGAQCRVELSDAGGATTATATVTDGDPSAPDGPFATTFAMHTGGTAVAFDAVFDVAALEVTKQVAGEAAWAANIPYQVTVTCTLDGVAIDQLGPEGAVVLTFEPDGTPVDDPARAALGELPVGAVCSTLETEDGGATSVAVSPPDPVTVASDGSAVSVVNTFDATTLTVAKTLGGNDAAAHALDPFSFDLGCTFNGLPLPNPPSAPDAERTFFLTGGASESFGGLPVGADCRVLEHDTRHATSVTPALEQSAVLDAEGATLSFANAFDVTELDILELLTGPGADTYGAVQTFRAEATCRYPDGEPAVLPDDGWVALDAGNGFAASVLAPVGTTCSVGQEQFLATAQEVSAPVTLLLGGDHTVTVTSDYQLGSLTIGKTALGTFDPDEEFAFDVHCSWPDTDQVLPLDDSEPGTFDLRSGESRTVQALAYALCSSTETLPGGALRVDSTATGTGAVSGSVTASVHTMVDDPASIAVTNFMPGSLPVTGAEWRVAGLIALVAFAFGAAMLLIARARRRRASA